MFAHPRFMDWFPPAPLLHFWCFTNCEFRRISTEHGRLQQQESWADTSRLSSPTVWMKNVYNIQFSDIEYCSYWSLMPLQLIAYVWYIVCAFQPQTYIPWPFRSHDTCSRCPERSVKCLMNKSPFASLSTSVTDLHSCFSEWEMTCLIKRVVGGGQPQRGT